MAEQGMESIVNCPICGEQVYVVMKSYEEKLPVFIKMLESQIGIGNTDHFEGMGKCKCGKLVKATLHVSTEGQIK